MSLNAVLQGSEKRADDLRRTLLSFDPARAAAAGDRDGVGSVFSTFEKLSQQLGLLLDRSSDPTAQAILERHFAVPSSVSGFDRAPIPGLSATDMPGLLSTMPDAEHQDALPLIPRLDTGTPESSASTIVAHNEALDAAHEHFAQIVLASGLPGAAKLATNTSVRSTGISRTDKRPRAL